MVAGNFPPEIGGPATQAWHLCRVLRAHGVNTIVATFGERTGREEREGVTIYRCRLRWPGGAAGKAFRLVFFSIWFVRIALTEKPDVIHCHDAFPHSLASGLIGRLLGIPTIIKFAGDMVLEKVNARSVQASSIAGAHEISWRYRLLAHIERWGLNRFNVVWAASEFRRHNLLETLRVSAPLIRVIPNYIELPPASENGHKRNGTTGCFTVLSAGRFAAHKRLDRTFKAIAALPAHARLRLVGEGDAAEEREVDALIAACGLEARVDRLGKQNYGALIGLMESSDVLLSTSEEEGFGIVFVEAMAAGLPIVALRIGAIPEVVPDGEAGFLVAQDDFPSLVERLTVLMHDVSLRKQMGSFGRRHARKYDLSEHWTVFRDLYYEVVDAQQSRRN